MSGALRFNRIKVQNVGILGEKVIDLGPLTPGINIISGPNECGKSSIVRALRAALFQRHGSGHASVKALQPHGSKAGPNVEVEFEVDGAAYVLEKQFLKKGFARVRAKDGSLALEGDEADQWLIATLDAREAAKKGSNPDDMGVWGLLWVNQDEFATQEPAERMGEHVRGSLAHAIGSLVGNVMGGAHGVQLRDAIDAEYAAVWTPKQEGRATGKLLGAREDVERLTREVAEFQRKVDDTVKLGDDLLERERDFEEHTTAGGSLQREVDECARAVEQGNAVEKERDAAAVALREASETLARATAVLVQREARRVELAKADELARAQGAVVEQLRAKERRLAADEQVAAREEVAARRDADGIQRTLAEQTQRLEQMRAREELTRLEQDLDEARRLDGLIREDRERLRALPDGEALASIQAVEGKRVEREEYLRRHATRVTVAAPGETPAVHFVALHKTITVGELGSLIVDPPREGFIKANARWRENREQLRARLGAIGVASVSAARTLAERRGALEEELASVRAKLLALAPKGIEALSAEADRADRERADSARAREAATERRDEVTRLEQSIAGVTASDAAVKELEGLEARVRTLIEVEARSAVRVTLRPLAAVLVQVGTRETPRVLTAGVEVRRPIAAPTTITVGGQIEIEIDPGTAVREEGVDAAAAQQELSTRLSAMGFETLEEAQAQAKMRARDEALRDEAERQLKALAPHGVAALGEQGLRRERIAEELRRKVEEARGHAVVIASREQDARDLPITREAFAELDGLDRQCLADEQLARRLAARIVSASGRLASAWEGREDLLDVTEVTAEGVRIEVVPGEVAPDFELPVVERDLQMKLHAIGAASVQDAVAAHVRWGALHAEVAERQHALGRVAPRGVAVLETEVATRRSRAGEVPTEAASSRDTLELAQTVEQKRHEAALETLAAAVPRSAQAKRLHEDAHSELVAAESVLHRNQAEHNALASLLRAEEESTSDARLRAAVEGATAEAARCRTRDEAALRAWEMAMPEVRRADLERTQRVLLEHGLRTKALLEELNVARGRLGALLPEGHFDRLAEKQTALEEAKVVLARLERQANAVRLLRETAASAYTEAQQRLMEPVYKEAMPLLQMIRPGTTIKMNESTLRLEQVRRNGYDEDFEELSGGAREQLAVVVRVALARVFARQRRAMPLILDDVLGWTDDRRLRSMINVLEKTAQDMQIILLTCHPGRFRSVMGASTFELDQLKEATPVG
jgi:energy-coupling factor transporter ATP-binding protein EcfA2